MAISGASRDLTKLKQAEELQRLLLNESFTGSNTWRQFRRSPVRRVPRLAYNERTFGSVDWPHRRVVKTSLLTEDQRRHVSADAAFGQRVVDL